jgi:hypothetical protein
MADSLYNHLEEELALAALQSPWLTPLVNERSPALPERPAPEPAAEGRPIAKISETDPRETDLPFDEESDSCRLELEAARECGRSKTELRGVS